MMKVFVGGICLAASAWAFAAPTLLPTGETVPGGVAVLPLPVDGDHTPAVKLGEHRIMVFRHGDQWYALVGIGLDAAPGELTLRPRLLLPQGLIPTFVFEANQVFRAVETALNTGRTH